MEYGRPSPPPRRTQIRHPISSYVPFFVFLTTLVLIVALIAFLAGRLMAVVGAHPPAATATATPLPPSTPTAVAARPRATPTLLPVVFSIDQARPGVPMAPARHFGAAVPHIYAFATLRRVRAGAPVRFLWVYGRRRAPVLDIVEHGRGPAYARYTFLSYITPDGARFATGVYTVTVTLTGRPVARGTFGVRPP